VPARDEEVLVSSIDPESGVVLTKWVASVAWLGVEHDDIDGSDAAQVDFPIDFHADQEWMAWKDRYINDQWFFVLEIVDEDRHRLRVRRNLKGGRDVSYVVPWARFEQGAPPRDVFRLMWREIHEQLAEKFGWDDPPPGLPPHWEQNKAG